MKTRPVVLGYCHDGTVRAEFLDSVASLLARYKLENRISACSGPRIATARNDIVRMFLKGTAKYLWMVDTDIAFTPEVLDRLIDLCEPVSAALYHGKDSKGTFPMLHRYDGSLIQRVESEGGVMEVDATGAGCLLIERTVLEAMAQTYEQPHPWFAETTSSHGQELGEDVTFCIRARSLGFNVVVDTDTVVGHVKTEIV